MINRHTVLAVIPARSGSKRCPGKNFRDFRGRPLYLWSVQQAYDSKYIDTVMVSRDKDRPPELCADEAMNEDVLRHHLKQYPHDIIVLLQPTSPLRTAEDIDKCIEICRPHYPALTIREDGSKNGAVYVAYAEWLKTQDFSAPVRAVHIMPDSRSLDIDYPEQFDA